MLEYVQLAGLGALACAEPTALEVIAQQRAVGKVRAAGSRRRPRVQRVKGFAGRARGARDRVRGDARGAEPAGKVAHARILLAHAKI